MRAAAVLALLPSLALAVPTAVSDMEKRADTWGGAVSLGPTKSTIRNAQVPTAHHGSAPTLTNLQRHHLHPRPRARPAERPALPLARHEQRHRRPRPDHHRGLPRRQRLVRRHRGPVVHPRQPVWQLRPEGRQRLGHQRRSEDPD